MPEAPEVSARPLTTHQVSLPSNRRIASVLRQVQQDTRSHYVAHSDPQVIAGQGTVALEMLQELPALDALIIPVGGGGLLGGMAILQIMKPSIRVYGAEPVGADDAHRSLITGKPLPKPSTNHCRWIVDVTG